MTRTRDKDAASEASNFTEHLRTVHFSLLTLCLGLVVVITNSGPTEIALAHQQIGDILEIQRTWTADLVQLEAERFMKSYGRKVLFEDTPPVAISTGPIHYSVKLSPNWLISAAEFDKLSSDSENTALPHNNFSGGVYFSPPVTLSDFQRQWTWLSHVVIVAANESSLLADLTLPENKDYERFNDDWSVQIVEYSDTNDDPQNVRFDHPIKFSLSLIPDDLQRLLEKATSKQWPNLPKGSLDLGWIGATDLTHRFVILATHAGATTVNLQDCVIRRFPTRWRRGEYEEVFRELNTVAADFADLPVDRIAAIIQKEVLRTKDPFEAFGVKFPLDRTARWGIFLILAVQFYFFLHFREFHRRALRPSGVAWIGAYPTWLPRIVFVFTSFVLPFVVISFVAGKELTSIGPQWVGYAMAGLPILVSGALTSLGLSTYVRCGRRLRSA